MTEAQRIAAGLKTGETADLDSYGDRRVGETYFSTAYGANVTLDRIVILKQARSFGLWAHFTKPDGTNGVHAIGLLADWRA